ncbi:MAG TPA: hypothetical protein VM802_03775 [Chitinophaga sp.]|uniref:hypothetical protein n=1 Tax=Chitinophaga sp. TaxID=1869181 RepID=UPI002C17AD01|nr:hypothetical protein [Chitinophaga sp.]HVI43954.1 hypothetical protein [Chitinophaga sp.]
MKIITGLFACAAFLAACSQPAKQASHEATHDSAQAMTPEGEEKQYDVALVANKRDPFCRMPVKAGIYDTAHYNNMVLGFCSSACKDSFLLHPDNFPLELKQ